MVARPPDYERPGCGKPDAADDLARCSGFALVTFFDDQVMVRSSEISAPALRAAAKIIEELALKIEAAGRAARPGDTGVVVEIPKATMRRASVAGEDAMKLALGMLPADTDWDVETVTAFMIAASWLQIRVLAITQVTLAANGLNADDAVGKIMTEQDAEYQRILESWRGRDPA